ncbi:MAG TPA: NlpC/P60 family protein [Candidatus Limnocylindria bacterium]|nr:NlpC/P60 family protein [Candidatus Limnocylindria bacterium]
MRKLSLLLIAAVIAATLVAVDGGNRPVEASSEASKITSTLVNQLGKRYSWGATGMRRYDCSGLVYRVFERNGLLNRIGGGRKTAAGYYKWFRDRGLVTRSPRKGDLVVWGRGRHIGIYIGDGRAISALTTTGVSRHAVKGLTVGFTAYLRVKLSR